MTGAQPTHADARLAARRVPDLEAEIARLERHLLGSARDLRKLRRKFKLAERARAEVAEIRDEWHGLETRWWVFAVALLVAFVLGAYLFYMNLGWYADQRALPPSSDWLLDQLPALNLVPLLSWGWLALHAYALGAALLYTPRRMPFLLFLIGTYLLVRTLFVFLSPVGAPERILDMRELDGLFPLVAGTYTFQNEFVFSGHTAVPFLFALYFETRWHKGVMLCGSLVMAGAVLLTHNHYTVDVLSAYFVGYSIYALSRALFPRGPRPGRVPGRAAAGVARA
ncbi:MAG: phosphatase PAP2-related protein [Myxococcota bacterium]